MITTETSERIYRIQDKLAIAREVLNNVMEERAVLIREVYESGTPVQVIKQEFNTTLAYLYKVIPEAFSVEIQKELVIKEYELKDKEIYWPK